MNVFKAINLEIVDGEFMVLVGLFGCGKSILLWFIVGLEIVIGGNIFIGDCWVNDLLFKVRDIVMVF